MKTFDVVIGKSAGNIVFGMSRSEARILLGKYTEFENTLVKMNSYDHFDFCQLGYDKNNKVNFVCFHKFEDIEVKLKNKVISDMTPFQLFAYIYELDNNIEVENGGPAFRSDTLGIGVCFEKTLATDLSTEKEIVYEKLANITIVIPGYWNKYEPKK